MEAAAMNANPLDRRNFDVGYNVAAMCACGHTAYWHGQVEGAPAASGGCDHCECQRFSGAEATLREVWIVFDGPPGPESGRFVEVEDGHGHGLGPATTKADWQQRGDGLWELGPFRVRETADA